MRPLIVVSDVHLGHRSCDDVAADLARLIGMYPDHEIVLNGDTFNLACDAWDRDPAVSASAMIAAQPPLRAALTKHLAGQAPVTFIAGNHDLAIQRPAVRTALLALLSEGATVDLRVEPWIVKRGGVHIEHGHLYDPGNSPTHPLAVPRYRAEPVGIELTRRFVGRYEAWDVFADHWTGSATDNVKLMRDFFGARAVTASLYYCWLLAVVNVETAVPMRLTVDQRAGESALPLQSQHTGIPESALRQLLDGRHRPMHFSFVATFLRFGFDALLAMGAIAGGVVAALVTRRAGMLLLSAAGLGYLLAARHRLAHRGANHMPEDLREGAALVHHVTDARLVIMGHTHREDTMEGYLNLGAFGDRPTDLRTYVHVDENGHAERRRIPVT